MDHAAITVACDLLGLLSLCPLYLENLGSYDILKWYASQKKLFSCNFLSVFNAAKKINCCVEKTFLKTRALAF